MAREIASITQIPGIFAGNCSETDAGTGVTVIVCPKGATGGVDVRGGAPATRETDLLRPEETVSVLHAVVLSGGSAYGLSAKVRPTSVDGIEATMEALDNPGVPLERGNVGAGTGATVGKIAGPERSMKTGLGEDVQVSGGLIVGAVSAVNAVGDVFDPETHEAIAGVLGPDGSLAANTDELLRASAADMPLPRTNTTISCIVTNAKLTKAEATKVAQMSADAYAHTILPTHTTNDGDTIFVMATGEVEAMVDVVGALAVRALGRAIADSARSATGAFGLKAACDL